MTDLFTFQRGIVTFLLWKIGLTLKPMIPWRGDMNEVFVCVVGVPDCHRGSPQAGSAGIRAHVCAGARRSLFHPFRSPHARGL